MTAEKPPPLAFIYDRKTSDTASSEGILRLRLAACREWAQEIGYDTADGEWVDRGDAALRMDHRPALEQLLDAMREARTSGRTVLCLVNDWDRLANLALPQIEFRRKIQSAGGWTETAIGENDREPGTRSMVAALYRFGL
jgi:DNA invertase Pin-like site-specific DNA recombinase